MDQFQTPLYDSLVRHRQKEPISLHVPGHKSGILFWEQSFYKDILKIDVTELRGLDDLHSPEEAIFEAEDLLSHLYETKRSFFLVNGSTVGNLAMIMATIKEGQTVLVQRNCHKSVLNGIYLTKGNPVLLGPEYNENWGVAGGVSVETVKRAIQLYPDSKALILTYPNYYGMVTEIEDIIKLAHSHHIPVLIDEAHGAHFIAGEYFPPSALQLGADVVVQSAHKTLPAMTMGSYLHVNGDRVSVEAINRYLRILQSSSPSYPIMASLDLARSFLGTMTTNDLKYLREQNDAFRAKLKEIKAIELLDYPDGIGDPLKITIQSKTVLSGFELQKLFEAEGIFTELADPYNVLFTLPLLREGFSFPFDQIIEKMKKALASYSEKSQHHKQSFFKKSAITNLYIQESLTKNEDWVRIDESVGYICAEQITPYPPGIPLLIPGEKIEKEDVASLQLLLNSGASFQGGNQLVLGKIKVFFKDK
ncbi:aminotransferase class I/II-fold pyridoxal phosphate-dependent enzyme [Cytobacillus sp. FJAT-54145]|uniref:Aminotransferase class I/II-fold pyridoxal phosphate-dependent enzyme n=1 Tax=Cytobacillus spartinae TaxID=3299023 RepID=A0ABW6KJ00_9BACI